MLNGVDETQADLKPSPSDWSVKEILAHLITTERDWQAWITGVLSDGEPNFPANQDTRLQAVLHVYPSLPELMDEFIRSMRETVALVKAMPESFPNKRKGSYMGMGYGLLQSSYHFDVHKNQIQDALRSADRP